MITHEKRIEFLTKEIAKKDNPETCRLLSNLIMTQALRHCSNKHGLLKPSEYAGK